MPFSLVIVVSPKIIYIDDKDEVTTVKKSDQPDAASRSSQENLVSLETLNNSSMLTTTAGALTEVNLRKLASDIFENLYAESVLYTRPSIIEDESSNSLQVHNAIALSALFMHGLSFFPTRQCA